MNTSTITLRDNTKIHKKEWVSSGHKAHLLIVHGYAEHCGRYEAFAHFLNSKGISVTSYDQRGYGKSDGVKAYVNRVSDYVDDLQEMIETIEGPFFLMGHSMGGMISVKYAIDKNYESIQGLIASSSLLEIDPGLSPVLQALAPILGAIFPKLPFEKLDKTYLTRDPKVLDAYMNDPLMYLGGTRARTGAEFLKTIKENQTSFDKIKLPLLVLHGEGDRLTMPAGSKKLHAAASSTDKTLKLYPELVHELIHEPEKEVVMNDIAQWILDRS